MKKLFSLFMMLLIMAVLCGVAMAHDGCDEHGTQQMVVSMDLDGASLVGVQLATTMLVLAMDSPDDGPVGLIGGMPLITAMNEKEIAPIFKDNTMGVKGLPHSIPGLVAVADIKYLPDIIMG